MTLSIDPVEALWVISNFVAIVVTAMSLLEGLRDRAAAKRSSVEIRITAANGIVRREVFRLLANGLLLSIVIPGLSIDRPVVLSAPVIALVLVPLVLLVATLLDRRERWVMTEMLLAAAEFDRGAVALETSVQQNITLTEAVSVKADAAYVEANTVNQKIANLTKALDTKVENLPADGDVAPSAAEDIVVEVDDLLVPKPPIALAPVDELDPDTVDGHHIPPPARADRLT